MSDVYHSSVRQGAIGALRRLAMLCVLSFRAQWIFFAVPAVYLATNYAMLSHLESYGRAPLTAVLYDLVSFSIPAGLVLLLVLRLIQYAVIVKPASPLLMLASEVRNVTLRPAHVVNALPVFAAMVFFNKAMFELKPAIPALNPFSWDGAFMQLDRVLHFGADPWVLLQPLLGFDYITFAINIAYNFWFLALFGTWIWFGFRGRASELRTRFFVAYMLAWWVGGGLLAVLFSSAGPAYYGALGLAPDPFAPLMAYHADVNTRIPLWFLGTQQLLWDGYTGKAAAIGISAFPSMHNASAAIFALAMMRVHRGVGIAFAIYAAVILVGSVHLGWHYAVDGYAGLMLGWLAWTAAGPVARWHAERTATKRLNEELAAL